MSFIKRLNEIPCYNSEPALPAGMLVSEFQIPVIKIDAETSSA
jgi:hypothetical protein